MKDDIEDNLEVENTNAVKNILSQLNDNDKRKKNPTRKPVQMTMQKYSNMNTNKDTEENDTMIDGEYSNKKKNQKKKLARDVKENKKLKADKKPYELLNMFDRIHEKKLNTVMKIGKKEESDKVDDDKEDKKHMKVEDVAKDIDNNEAKKEDKEIKINIKTEDVKVAKVIKEDKIASFKDIKMKFERGEDETKDE